MKNTAKIKLNRIVVRNSNDQVLLDYNFTDNALTKQEYSVLKTILSKVFSSQIVIPNFSLNIEVEEELAARKINIISNSSGYRVIDAGLEYKKSFEAFLSEDLKINTKINIVDLDSINFNSINDLYSLFKISVDFTDDFEKVLTEKELLDIEVDEMKNSQKRKNEIYKILDALKTKHESNEILINVAKDFNTKQDSIRTEIQKIQNTNFAIQSEQARGLPVENKPQQNTPQQARSPRLQFKALLVLYILQAFIFLGLFLLTTNSKIIFLAILILGIEMFLYMMANIFETSELDTFSKIQPEQTQNPLNKTFVDSNFLIQKAWVGALDSEIKNIEELKQKYLGGNDYNAIMVEKEKLEKQVIELADELDTLKDVESDEFLKKRRRQDIIQIEVANRNKKIEQNIAKLYTDSVTVFLNIHKLDADIIAGLEEFISQFIPATQKIYIDEK